MPRSVSYTHLDVYKRQGREVKIGHVAAEQRVTHGAADERELMPGGVECCGERGAGSRLGDVAHGDHGFGERAHPSRVQAAVSSTPVSYTHLDVYKRQVIRVRVHEEHPRPALKPLRCLAPVSYTHLDVYKRQGFGNHLTKTFTRFYSSLHALVCLLYTSRCV